MEALYEETRDTTLKTLARVAEPFVVLGSDAKEAIAEMLAPISWAQAA